MSYKQKFRYTVLGTITMLIGLIISAIVSPPLIAQRRGVFDEIECSRLTVVDKNGAPAIVLLHDETLGNSISLVDKAGNIAASFYVSDRMNGLSIMNLGATPAASINSTENGNNLTLYNDTGKDAITLDVAHALGRIIGVFNEQGKAAIGLSSLIERDSNFLSLQDKAGKNVIELVSDVTGTGMRIYDTAGNVSWQAK